MTKFTVAVHFDEETQDYVLPFPEELLEDLKWNIGDTLTWIDNLDGTYTIKKIDDN
jgi:bifunctional DNA-binding transcriptional regulator/antitoxin component of YhaV-PrlF toxin-antitoxin module